MKSFTKALLAVALVFGVSFLAPRIAEAQVIFFEDFEAGVIPNTWTLINNDGLTPSTNVSYVTDAWVARPDFTDPTDTVAVSTSWYSPAGAADDWLITPAITLGPTSVLEWQAKAQDPSYPDGYQVRISTAGTSISDFQANPTLLTQNPEVSTWTTRSVSLSAYANQTVYIAFRNNSNDKFLLLLDDIQVRNPPSTDARVLAAAGPASNCELTAFETIYALIDNYGGTPISNFDVSYTINGGTPVTETFTGSIAPGEDSLYTFTTLADFSVEQSYAIQVYVTASGDADVTNDTADAPILTHVAPVTADGYLNDFEATIAGWTNEDVNADDVSWFPINGISNSGTNSMVYVYNPDGTTAADDWLFSTCLDVQADSMYRLKFQYVVGDDGSGVAYPEKLEVKYGSSPAASAMSMNIKDLGTISNITYEEFSEVFTASATGTIYIGFHAYSDPDNYYISIDDVSIMKESEEPEDSTSVIERSGVVRSLGVYPNPADKQISIDLNMSSTVETTVSIQNMLGQTVNEQYLGNALGRQQFTFDLSNQAPGIYFVKIQAGEDILSRKFILAR